MSTMGNLMKVQVVTQRQMTQVLFPLFQNGFLDLYAPPPIESGEQPSKPTFRGHPNMFGFIHLHPCPQFVDPFFSVQIPILFREAQCISPTSIDLLGNLGILFTINFHKISWPTVLDFFWVN
jgi:hypothetical protein